MFSDHSFSAGAINLLYIVSNWPMVHEPPTSFFKCLCHLSKQSLGLGRISILYAHRSEKSPTTRAQYVPRLKITKVHGRKSFVYLREALRIKRDMDEKRTKSEERGNERSVLNQRHVCDRRCFETILLVGKFVEFSLWKASMSWPHASEAQRCIS